MGSQTILVIRHAEKPEPGGETAGVDEEGGRDAKSLTPRGWQRAGAWTELFVPSLAVERPLPAPSAIFASAPSTGQEDVAGAASSKSKRPLETISGLAAKLGVNVDLRFSKGQEAALASVISLVEGVVLVCWQHEDITTIARGLGPISADVPGVWPSDRFNVMFRFDRPGRAASWTFSQVVPVMLDGDKQEPL